MTSMLHPAPPVRRSGSVSFPGADHEVIDGLCRIPRLRLRHGATLRGVRLAWRLTGAQGAPVVAVLGGISASRQVTAEEDAPGWWSPLIGPGRGLDTRRYRVLSFDWLGGSGASTGPIPGSHSSEPFPAVSPQDQAGALQHILDQLDVARLHAFLGASYGGMVGLAFAAAAPDRIERLIVVSAAHRAHPLATAWRSIQRRIVRLGLALDAAPEALAIARGLAMTTYRTPEEFDARFAGGAVAAGASFQRFPVDSYLEARGADFVKRMAPEAFLCLSESIDLQHLDPAVIKTPTTLIGVRQDQLVPIAQLRGLAQRISGPSRLIEIDSRFGHDAFLKEEAILTGLVHRALETTTP